VYAAAVLEEMTRLGVDVEWHIVGDGPLMAWLKTYAQESAVQHLRVVVYGSLTSDEALAVLRTSDVMILPSKASIGGSDGIPVALIESMAAGVLAVSTPVGGIPELVVDNVTGIMGDPQDPAACAHALVAVLSDEVGARAHVV
jgi:colanic acid/amylovoran biosynthesis glycosyltransferase